MKLKKIFFLCILIAGISNTITAKQAVSNDSNTTLEINSTNDDIIIHIVVKGETVYSIASAYNTTVKEIYRLNPDAEKGLKEGSKLQIPKVRKASGYSSHLIESKETLYSVSRLYHMTVDEIKSANTGLDENTFQVGKTIRIPIYSEANTKGGYPSLFPEHRVTKGDTLYNIGKAYNVSVEALYNANPILSEGLKEGMMLQIPKKQITDINTVNTTEPFKAQTITNKKEEVMRIGVILPFLENTGSIQKDKITEYYEGFLLAVKDMKEKGLNAEIYTFDIGSSKDTKRLDNLLGTTEINSLNLLIGGISKQQIELLSKFSKKTGIKYVIPFESRNTGVESNPNMFQMTTSHVSLYGNVISAFIDKFDGYNIVFVSESGSDNDKSDFVSDLKKELTKSKIQYKTTASTSSLIDDIKYVLSTSEKNILIPTSSSEISLRRITTAMKTFTDVSVSLFGYPEWQAYAQLTNSLHQFNTHIYTIFFLDEQQNDVQGFIGQYKKWYNSNLINSYPKYGFLGYDTGLYFLSALNKYGSHFDSNAPEFKVRTLQSAIHFKQANSKGGFINNGIYFVHYKTDLSIEKIDISK